MGIDTCILSTSIEFNNYVAFTKNGDGLDGYLPVSPF